MRKNFFLLMVILTLAACSGPLILQNKKNVDMKDQLFAAHGSYDQTKPLLYTIDTTYMPKVFSATGAEQDQLLNLQNNANNFGVVKNKPGTTRVIRGVANRPFDVFQAEVLPGTNIIKKDENGIPMIKPLFRVNSVPKMGFNMFVSRTDNPVVESNLTQNNTPADNTRTTMPGNSGPPQKGPDPIGKEAVEYILRALPTNEYEDQADNRFRIGTMYEVSWDAQAYPNMYKIVQRDDDGNLREIPVYGNMAVIDIRYGSDLQFYYMDGNQPTIALYNFDKPDAQSLIGLEPKGNQGWFRVNPGYTNYHGDGWNGQNNNQTSGGVGTMSSGIISNIHEFDDNGQAVANDATYWDYPNREPAAYPKGPRRLTEDIIRRDYYNGRIQFILPILKKTSPNFFDELWRKGWIYPHQDTFNIDPNTLQNNFPEVSENMNNLAPGSWHFIKTDNPLPPRPRVVRKKASEPKPEVQKSKPAPKQETKPTQPSDTEIESGAGSLDDSGVHAYPLENQGKTNQSKANKPKTDKPKAKPTKKSTNQQNNFWDFFKFGG